MDWAKVNIARYGSEADIHIGKMIDRDQELQIDLLIILMRLCMNPLSNAQPREVGGQEGERPIRYGTLLSNRISTNHGKCLVNGRQLEGPRIIIPWSTPI